MFRFFDSTIKPLFMNRKVKKIIEIGAFNGSHTIKLLEYVKGVNGILIVVDPQPLFNVDEWCKRHAPYLHVEKNLSHHVLQKLTDYDAVLIDGDHNWYTVYHELKFIENTAQKRGKFPMVFLHDIEWPYARRDMYYFPETIPEPFRKPYAKEGIVYGQSNLAQVGGINDQVNNATYEMGERNGVLTAVEDFILESRFPIRFYKVSGNHGLGILTCEEIPANLENIVKVPLIKPQIPYSES